MTRVYGLHEIELHPGVNEEDFEKFVLNEMSAATPYPGWGMRLLKGDKGARKGKYLLLFDIESVEARDRLDENSEEAQAFDKAFREEWDPIFEKWSTFSPTDIGKHPEYTDYLILEK